MLLYVPKYSLFSLYYATCMHVFGADYLALDSQLMFLPPWEDHFSHSQLPSVAYNSLWVEAQGLPPIHFGVLLVSFLFSHVNETLWVERLTLQGDTVSQQTPSLSVCIPLFLSPVSFMSLACMPFFV